jgi:glycerophosphoryl diester phosphodiesterase
MLPTVLLGRTARYLTSGAATAVGATAVGPSLPTLKESPQLADRAIAQGRAVYCWNVDEYEDLDFCREVGVAWLATHHPGRTKAYLHTGGVGEGSG